MELYKIIATCNNYAGEGNPRTFDFIPENFEGVKITQKFSYQNPIGYTPKFSLETMKVIKDDKDWTDNIFDTYGLQSDVSIAISKLNSTATDYEAKGTFKIDFENYDKQDHFSEFPLKSSSCIDDYNLIKSVSKDINVSEDLLTLPTQPKFINYISVKNDNYVNDSVSEIFITLVENENSKIHNDDTALYEHYSDYGDYGIYEFNRSGTNDLALIANGQITIGFTSSGLGFYFDVKLYINDFSNPVATIAHEQVYSSGTKTILIDYDKSIIEDLNFSSGDFLFIGVKSTDPTVNIVNFTGDFSAELYVQTEKEANEYSRKIYYLKSSQVFNTIFNSLATVESGLDEIGITSAHSILKRQSYISIVPKDFLTDFCAANGAIVNFKNDGTVQIAKIETYFNNLLDKENAVEITSFKNVNIGLDMNLNISSVAVGMKQQKYDEFTYFGDWNKILTFAQDGRLSDKKIDLSLKKYRVDFSGILDFVLKTSKTPTDTAADLFLFDPEMGVNYRTSGSYRVYDIFTPRDILENWRKFLEFCFYNYDFDTLEIISNDGDDYNWHIDGIGQFDDFVFTGDNPKILPLKIEFSCLIDETDFTEKILTLNHNGEDLYIFVTEAETTDNLSEQKIKGNLIYFPET